MNGQRVDDPPGHAFISYVHEDRERVDRLQRALERAGIRVWRDTADLWPGQDWQTGIRNAITVGSLAFIACFSENSQGRVTSYQNAELVLAAEQMRLRVPGHSWLIPVRFADCAIPPFDLGAGRTLDSLHHVDLFDGSWERAIPRLVGAILGVLGTPGSVPGPDAAAGARARESRDSPAPLALRPQPSSLVFQVRQRLQAGGDTTEFRVVTPGRASDRVLRNALARHQLAPGEELIAAWQWHWRRIGPPDSLAFTSSGIRIRSGRIAAHIRYERFPDYAFTAGTRESPDVPLQLRDRRGAYHWLTIHGPGVEWSSPQLAHTGGHPQSIAGHLNFIKHLAAKSAT